MMSNIIIFIEATRETGVCFLIPIRGSYDKEINSSAREIFLQLTTPLQATIVSILFKVVDVVTTRSGSSQPKAQRIALKGYHPWSPRHPIGSVIDTFAS